MSSTNTIQLTEEQGKFLNDLEEEFRNRYTEDDEEFKAVLNSDLPPPPVVENWGESRPRNERPDHYKFDRNRDPYRRGEPYHNSDRRRYRHNHYDGEREPDSSRQDYRYRMRY